MPDEPAAEQREPDHDMSPALGQSAQLWTHANVFFSEEFFVVTSFQTVPSVEVQSLSVQPGLFERRLLGQFALTPSGFVSIAELFGRMAANWAGRFADDPAGIVEQIQQGIETGLRVGMDAKKAQAEEADRAD